MAMILLVEDDRIVAAALTRALVDAGHVVRAAAQAVDALRIATEERPDVVILDLGLPDIDGADALRMMRTVSDVPVIVATARRSEVDIINLLNAGADDYVTKPFGAEELLARIRVALRRGDTWAHTNEPIVRGGLVIDRERFRVVRDGEEIRLTPKEFELLTYLAQHPGRVLTHRTILKAVWGPYAVDQPALLRVLIGSLRRKIEDNASAPKWILTEPWVGYRFAEDGVRPR